MTRPHDQWTWEELIKSAQDGLKRSGAAIEAMRRVVVSVDAFSQSSDRYSKRIWWLSVVIGVFAAVQAVAAIDSIRKMFGI